MAVSIRESGRKIRPMGKGLCIIRMVMFTKVIGHKIKPMGMENTPIQMELNTPENGRMTNSMDMELNNGLTDRNMRESIEMELKLEKGF